MGKVTERGVRVNDGCLGAAGSRVEAALILLSAAPAPRPNTPSLFKPLKGLVVQLGNDKNCVVIG